MSYTNSINKGCGCSKPCGCGDYSLTTNTGCQTNTCANPEKCSETFSSDCAIYMGDTIANLNIYKGDRLTTVVQKLLQAIVNPGCAFPTSPCVGATGFGSTAVTSSTISLAWDAVLGATSYFVEYKLTSSPTWVANPTTTSLSNVIGGLSPNSDYHVRVNSTCSSGTCNSLVLTITTNP